MSTSYTRMLYLANPAANDYGWDRAWHQNQYLLDAVVGGLLSKNRIISGCNVTHVPGEDVLLSIDAGEIEIDSELLTIEEHLLQLNTHSGYPEWYVFQKWVYYDPSSGTVADDELPDAVFVLLAVVTMDSSVILNVADVRPLGYRNTESATRKTGAFVYGDLVDGILQFSHSLDVEFPSAVAIYNADRKQVSPSEIESVDGNTINIDLAAFGEFAGTWRIEVRS